MLLLSLFLTYLTPKAYEKKKTGETMKYKTFKYWGWKEHSYQKVLPGHRLLTGYRIIKTKESVFKISLHKQ